VTHPQAGVPAPLAVATGTSPVLDEELRQVEARGAEVLGVEGPEHRIGLDALVEAVHEGMEVLVAPHPLVERCWRRSCIVRDHVKQIIATGLRVSPSRNPTSGEVLWPQPTPT